MTRNREPTGPFGTMDRAERDGHDGRHEQVTWFRDPDTGLAAIVAIHSTALGPSLGGTRFRAYESERAALTDVLRLSAAMTLKNAAADLPLGGGKAVILGAPAEIRTDALMAAYGARIDALGGRYLTAEDVGTTQADMDLIATQTAHVTGTSVASGGSGDPSPLTAYGVFRAIAVQLAEGALDGRHIAISGVGKVGTALALHLLDAGASITVADVVPAAIQRLRELRPDAGARISVASTDSVHTTACDVFAPCALGGVLNEVTIADLRCGAVCGAANNQLATDADADRLAERGIDWAPDFVVNAGGVINIAQELRGPYDLDSATAAVAEIGPRLAAILERARSQNATPLAVATQTARARIAEARSNRGFRTQFTE